MSDESGSLEMSLVTEGNLEKGHLDTKDVFIVDSGKKVFVWVGEGASAAEKKNAMSHAHVSDVEACN